MNSRIGSPLRPPSIENVAVPWTGPVAITVITSPVTSGRPVGDSVTALIAGTAPVWTASIPYTTRVAGLMRRVTSSPGCSPSGLMLRPARVTRTNGESE